MKPHARQVLERPHRAEHDAALVARMETGIRPTTLRALLRWYAEALSEELPGDIHDPGVWRDFGADAVGASALGAPRYSDGFRRYIEGSPRQTDADGMYLFPVGAALAYLQRTSPRVVTWLGIVARCGFDYRRAASAAGKADDEAKAETFGALTFLWDACLASPPSSVRSATRPSMTAEEMRAA